MNFRVLFEVALINGTDKEIMVMSLIYFQIYNIMFAVVDMDY